jgi:hypothetical protein
MAHPLLFELNPRVLLYERSRELGRDATLDDLSDELFEGLASRGFEWVWFLGVWQIGPESRRVSREQQEWRQGYGRALPDVDEADIVGSPFAVQRYAVRVELGGELALERTRRRLAKAGLHLMLDFVPNHVGLDHPWVHEYPEFFIEGTERDLSESPGSYRRVETRRGPRILAHGRDPFFPPWPDSLQLNHRHPVCRSALIEVLRSVARRCDGVRCDMAMLVLPDVFQRTWGPASLPRDGTAPCDKPFWPEALASARKEAPGFVAMAEVYWDLELALQEQGFDYTYDKGLADGLRSRDAAPVRERLQADPRFQRRCARFLENHDEPRAAEIFPWPVHQAAAVICFLSPGLGFFHEGQFEGRQRHASMHLRRRLDEPPDPAVQSFYERLLRCLNRPEVRDGEWRLWSCRPAWEGNPTWNQFLVFSWEGRTQGRSLVVVNYGALRGQCYVTLRLEGLAGKRVLLQDLMGDARYEREGDALLGTGLYLDMAPWGYSVFDVRELGESPPQREPP